MDSLAHGLTHWVQSYYSGEGVCPTRFPIAGATGFVGTAIRNSLVDTYTVRGLTRSAYKMKHPNLVTQSIGFTVMPTIWIL